MYNSLKNEDIIEVKRTDKIIIDMIYPKFGFKKAIKKCFLRRIVYEKLKEAASYLEDGYYLLILDAYRPFELQEELYNNYFNKIEKIFDLSDYSKEQKDKIINKFVAIPDRLNPPAHTTGSAVDLTLIKDGKKVNMGCEFDEFSSRSYTNYYKDKDITIHNNRMILYNCMIKAGFTNNDTEYWHYDYGNRNWSEITGKEVIFSDIYELNKKATS